MNEWKIAFWLCLSMLILVTVFAAYLIIDQAYTVTYQQVGYKDTEDDLGQLIEIINKSELTKAEIKEELKDHDNFEFMDFDSDTISLNRVLFVFENDRLKKVEKQW